LIKESKLTLKELLASVLLEEGFVDQRPCQVVNHELDDGLNLVLGVASVVGKCLVLGCISETVTASFRDSRLTHAPQ
jgi:hypothetical protein